MILTLENRKANLIKEKVFYIGILSIITIVLWIALSVYTSYTKTSIDPKIKELIKPLNPVLDSQVLIEYTSSRVAAPEQFQIIAQIKNESNADSITKIIDPFNPENTKIQTPAPIASGSTEVVPEIDSL